MSRNPKKTSTPINRADDVTAIWISFALCAVIFGVFGQTFRAGFTNFDDGDYVFDNPIVKRGLTKIGLEWSFGRHAFNWHPVTWWSHMLDCQLFKLQPGWHHFTNVVLHAATAVLLFWVLRRMTGALWQSALATALFALHPLRAESVAWVAERKDVLSGLFFVLTLGAYERYVRGNNRKFFNAALVLFALGLMCKPMLVTLPLILLVLDYWPLQRTEPMRKLILEKLPFFALSAGSCLVTLWAQQAALQNAELYPIPLRFENAVVTVAVYLRQMVWPFGLAVLYPYPLGGLPLWQVGVATLVVVGISIEVVRRRKEQPWLLAGWIWFLVLLLPVIGIVQVGRQAHADRYTYLPQIGICLAVTWTVGASMAGRAVLAAAALALAVGASTQTAYWHDSDMLWAHTLSCTTGNYVAHNNYGNALFRTNQFEAAIEQERAALEIKPHFAEAHFNLGMALRGVGKLDEAVKEFKAALDVEPDYADAHDALANVLMRQGKPDEAIGHYEKAVALKPMMAEGHSNLGAVLAQNGRLDEAMKEMQTALAIAPGNESFHVNLAGVLIKKGRWRQAEQEFETALRLEPRDLEIENRLAWILATCPDVSARNGRRALELAQQANQATQGRSAVLLSTMGAALAESHQFDDAVKAAQMALDIAKAAGQETLVRQLEDEIKHYEASQPYQQ